jgi:predicted ATPase
MFLSKLNIIKSKFPTSEFYPFNLKIFHESGTIEFKTPITFFAGENGSGKSTLLAAIARKNNIHIWNEHDYRPLKHNKYSDQLHNCLQLEIEEEVPGGFFSAQNFKQYAELVDEWAKEDPGVLNYFGGESLALRSHGQTNMQYFRNRFKIRGLYLLDEPEAALSPKSQVELSQILAEVTSDGNVQFIIATHSPILLGLDGSTIYSFDQNSISIINYEHTDYYRIYKDFLLNRKETNSK